MKKKKNNAVIDSNTHSTDEDGERASANHSELNKFDGLKIIPQSRMFLVKKKTIWPIMGYSLNKDTFRIE